MNVKWTRYFDTDEEKKQFVNLLRQSSKVTEVLSKIVQSELNTITKAEENEGYDGDWAFLQAHRNGNKEAYRKMLNLLDLERNT